MKYLKQVPLLILVLALLQGCTQPSHWSQYLGPNRNATISGTDILKSWSEKGPKELWSFPLGEGYGGAAIYGDEVFILDREMGESDIMRCLDLNTGEEKWNYTYEAKGEIPFPGSRTVPTVDQNHIWIVGPHGDFYCFDKETGKPVWHYNLLEEFDRELSTWGVSQAPLIYNNLVIVAPQGMKSGVVAYQKITGELIWTSPPLNGRPFHASPSLASFGGTDQVIVVSPYDREDSTRIHQVVSLDAQSGKELWKYHGLKSFSTITPAVALDDQRLFLTEEAVSKIHPAVLYENHLYLNHTGNPNQMMCLTMEGEVVWEEKSAPGFELGALILVNGLIINQNGKNGDIHLIEPSPEGYNELGKASFFNSGKSQAWAPLAFSQGLLIVRDMEKMVCVDLQNLAD